MVRAYRRLAVAGVVSALAVAVRPEDADVAVGVLGPIADADPGLSLELLIDLDPAATSPPSSLTLLPRGSAPRDHAVVC